MYLRMAYTDRSGTDHPEAIFEVVGLHVELTRDTVAADVQLHVFHDLPSHDDGLPPFEERPPSPLTEAEIAGLEAQFRMAIYQTLQQRPEFTGSLIVP